VIAEVGCAETGGDKAQWLRDSKVRVTHDYSSLRAVVWFNVDKECDWRVDAATEILTAFRSSWGNHREEYVLEALSPAP